MVGLGSETDGVIIRIRWKIVGLDGVEVKTT